MFNLYRVDTKSGVRKLIASLVDEGIARVSCDVANSIAKQFGEPCRYEVVGE